MKQMITLRSLLVASCIAGASIANGQIHPLAFGARTLIGSTTLSDPNWYKDYVGLRFVVNSPAAVAGEKIYTHPGVGTTPWGTTVTTPIVNTQICMPPLGGDTLAASPFAAGSMAGKIGYVYRGGGVEFVCKAVACVNAGAIAVVIVNNINGGPVGMGAGSVCLTASVTVPVFMISKEDGDQITGLYRAGDTARFTITPWGLGLADDLGFVPGGIANWHNYAIPSNQLGASGNPFEYNMTDGAFIANYGTTDVTGVNVTATTTFSPGGTGTPVPVHTSTVSLASFPVLDSIYSMFAPTEYSLSASGNGRFDVTYNITHSVADGYPADNTMTSSFYTTDSLYSKGRYDFVAKAPAKTLGLSFGTAGFLWGPMYYVKNGGTAISRVQYSLSVNTTSPGTLLGGPTTIYLFKWVDGAGGQPIDSVMQDGELSLVSLGTHNYDGVNDTSGAALNFNQMGDPVSGNPMTVMLEAATWYYLAIEVPPSHFLGVDGITHPYPRIYGRALNSNILDYSNFTKTSLDDISANPTQGNIPIPNTFSNFINTVDSFNYANTKGIIPSVAMIVNNAPNDVKHVTNVSNAKVGLYPNPAKDQLNVSLSLENTSKKVTYTIIDGLGRLVSKEVHNNVKEDNFTVNTSKLASGHYFYVISTDDKTMSRNFVIAK